MKKIKLTQGKYALVDDEDYEWLNQWKWYVKKCDNYFYAARHEWKNGKDKIIYMHREITKCPKNKITDHINHNSLDNQKKNLRTCTKRENSRNKKKTYGKSTYKGAYSFKETNKWVSRLKILGKSLHFGYYTKEKDAALIYDYWANKLFGEFANLNFPNELLTESEFEKLNTKKERSSKYTGVSYNKGHNKWGSYIYKTKSQKHLGYFNSELDAAEYRESYIIKNKLENQYKLNFKEINI